LYCAKENLPPFAAFILAAVNLGKNNGTAVAYCLKASPWCPSNSPSSRRITTLYTTEK
jgi:hypothetical protein